MACIEIIGDADDKLRRYDLNGSRTMIGRSDAADIVLDDGAISQVHAVIERVLLDPEADGSEQSTYIYYLQDMGSTNGTYIDGAKVRRVPLHHQARVRFGRLGFVFHAE